MPIELERRKAVMARSVKLGHCVCHPQVSCPCDTLKEHNVCPCAGERLPARAGPVALTHYVRKAGCASKIGQADLKRILGRLPAVSDPNVLLGTAAGDDAGIYRLAEGLNLVQTVDVFTPCVDDPYLFGQIAAANSLSDIYAMGGRPLTALSIVGFPIDDLDGSLLEAMLQGGLAKLQEAGCSLIGGHSLQDQEVKCGFAVTGLIDARATVVRDNAQPGDVLVLTKPLGTGMISFAAQIGRLDPKALAEAGQVMATLNREPAELMVRYQAHAGTDVTGFGLMGHLVEMARNSGVNVELDMSALPVFAAAVECLEQEILPGAIERNQDYAMAWVRVARADHPKHLPLLYDPQTSGGLLISLPEARALELVQALRARGHAGAAIIGRVKAKGRGHSESEVSVLDTSLANIVGTKGCVRLKPIQPLSPSNVLPVPAPGPVTDPDSACCSIPTPPPPTRGNAEPAPFEPAAPSVSMPPAAALFKDFLAQANQPGQLGQRTKKLMAIALSVATRCQPCLSAHLEAARAMGISQTEIDEAAWLAIAFGGAPALMLYREATRHR